MNRYERMSDDELTVLAKERVKATGAYKQTAIRAQRELYNRHHWTLNEASYDDGVIERRTEDIDYNG